MVNTTVFVGGMLLAAAFGAAWANPVANTECGKVEGTEYQLTQYGVEGNITAFLDIPYAEPPVGDMRWKPAKQFSSCWSGTWNATYAKPMCPQNMTFPRGISEDCLTISIWSNSKNFRNATTSELLPVVFWIYGGSLVVGSNDYYGHLERLALFEDFIIVAPNYRLGALGFLALKELSETDPRGTSGNFGYTDQLEALRWVQRNIKNFGGDPSRVTLLGQSSGGTSIFALLAAPESKGLFSGAIGLSGSPNFTMTLPAAEYQGQTQFVANTRCASAVGEQEKLQCLRELPWREVLDATPSTWNVDILPSIPTTTNGMHLPGLGIVDGVTIPFALETALSAGLIDVPIIFSVMAQEMDIGANATVAAMSPAEFKSAVRSGFSIWGPGTGDAILDFYAEDVAVSPEKAYNSFSGDFMVGCGNIEVTKAAAKGFQSPVYYFRVEMEPANPTGYHFSDPANHYAFHMHDYLLATRTFDLSPPPTYQPQEPDFSNGDLLRSTWVELIKNGKISSDLNVRDIRDVPPGSSFPADYVANVFTSPGRVSPELNNRAEICMFYLSKGIDSRYWWVN